MSGSVGNRTFEIRITGDASGVQNALRGAASAADRAGRDIQAGANRGRQGMDALTAGGGAAEQALASLAARAGPLGQALGRLGPGGLAAAAGLATAGAALSLAVREAEKFERSGMRTEAIIRATGHAAGLTAQNIRDMSESIARDTLASTSGVEQAAQKLLTFRSVASTTFERTLRAAQDLAATGFGTIESAAVQLGKALEDPERGLSALAESGVSFTASQRAVIATMMETGRQAEAQRIILEAVEKQVGGAGRAEAGGLAGAYDTLGQNVQEALRTLGNLGPLQAATNAINLLATAVGAASRGLRAFADARAPESVAEAALAAAERRLAQLRESHAAHNRGGAYGPSREELAAQAQALGIAEAQVREAQERLNGLRAQGAAEAARIAAEGEATRRQMERDAAQSALDALQASRDRSLAIERTYQQSVATINRAATAGLLDQAGAQRELAAAQETRRKALADLARQARSASAQEVEAHTRVRQAVQREEAAVRRELEAARLGVVAREEVKAQLEMERQLREAGIPIIERRTAAEQASAEAIERSVRATRGFRAEMDRLDDAARESARAAQKALEDVARTAERISDDAAEAIFDSLTGERRAQGVLDWFKTLFKRIAVQALSANILLPISTAVVGAAPWLFGIGGGGGAAGAAAAAGGVGGLGGLGQLLGLGSSINNLTGGGLMNSLGLGGVGSAIGGWLSAPLWGGTSGLSAAALSGPGGLAALEAAGGAAGGFIAPSLMSLLAPAGLGALGGGLLASFTGGNQIGGSVGGGLGAAAGFALASAGLLGPVGPVLAAVLGGAGGGLLGGLFGNNGKGFSGGDALVGRDNAGGLVFSGFAGKNFDGSELTQQAQQEIAAFNARLQAAGVFVNSGMRASIGGGGSTAPRTLTGALDAYGFGLGSNDPRIAAAIAPYAGNIEGALAIAEEAKAVAEALDALKTPTGTFAAAMKALDAQFKPLWESTVKLGFGFEELNVAWTKAQQDLQAERDRTVAGLANSIRVRDLRLQGREGEAALIEYDARAAEELRQLEGQLTNLGVEAGAAATMLDNLRGVQARERAELAASATAAGGTLARLGQDIDAWLARMRTTPAGGFSATEQLVNARAQFDETLAGARLNDADALRGITGAAEAYLQAYRAVNGSAGFGQVRDWVLDSVGGLEAVTQARLPAPAANTVTMNADPALLAENAALRQQISALRAAVEASTEANERLAFALPPVVVGRRA